MVSKVKIPRHGGPDGQGLPRESFDQLLEIVSNNQIDNNSKKQAIELCLSASTQNQWNEEYRQELIKRIE